MPCHPAWMDRHLVWMVDPPVRMPCHPILFFGFRAWMVPHPTLFLKNPVGWSSIQTGRRDIELGCPAILPGCRLIHSGRRAIQGYFSKIQLDAAPSRSAPQHPGGAPARRGRIPLRLPARQISRKAWRKRKFVLERRETVQAVASTAFSGRSTTCSSTSWPSSNLRMRSATWK